MTGKPYHIEVCVTSLEEAQRAFDLGADRIEICVALETEGLTPPFELVDSIKKNIPIPFRIMVRETSVGYAFTSDQLPALKNKIVQLDSLNPEGWVIGFMENGRVNLDALEIVVPLLNSRPITFHKAIDSSIDIEEEIKMLSSFPQIDTILTSGGMATAWEGREMIRKMQSLFQGNIMAGGRITSNVLPALHEELQLNWYHGKNIL